MGSPFKMSPKTPFMKALVGKQGNLPEHLKKAILDAPAKKTDKKLKKQQGTKETGDVGVTYYGTEKSLASGQGPSENQPSASGDVFASSYKRGGRTAPSTQSFKEAREREAMEEKYDREQAKKKGKGKSALKMTDTKKGGGKKETAGQKKYREAMERVAAQKAASAKRKKEGPKKGIRVKMGMGTSFTETRIGGSPNKMYGKKKK